ncbi:unnamed protein product, partial [Didymodactylos carnosus]
RYNKTPCEEARTSEIEQLFNRSSASARNRFIEDTSEPVWTFCGKHADLIAQNNYADMYLCDLDTTISELNWATRKVSAQYVNCVKYFLKKLQCTRDVTYLLRLYTAETDFYRLLNEAIATRYSAACRMLQKDTQWAMFFASIVSRDTALDQFRCTELVTYRGMRITDTDLSKYEVGGKIMNRSFLSTSTDRNVALKFLKSPTIDGKLDVLCTYTIVDRRAALDIHSVSEFPKEQEVLIVPWMAFVVKRKELKHPIEIELEQLPMEEDLVDLNTHL